MRTLYKIVIPGEPVAKGRPRVTKWGTYTPEKTINYETLVKYMFAEAYPENLPIVDEMLQVEIDAYFMIPKSASKKKAEAMAAKEIRPTKKPDLDNVAKAITDALNGLAYKDDSQVVNLIARKYYSQMPGVHVTISEV